MKKLFSFLAGIFCSLFWNGCSDPTTAGIPAVTPFDIKAYAGRWYEIARMPNWFEKGMSNVCAFYSLEPDGSVKVVNSGIKNGRPKSITGKAWFAVGEYKRLPNEVGGNDTVAPEDVPRAMRALLKEYNGIKRKSFEDIIDFHQRFEAIHPFQDGNGRVGRLVIFKECLANGFVPFIITEELKMFYYRGLQQWSSVRGYLLDTCLTAQDNYKALLDYFKIKY